MKRSGTGAFALGAGEGWILEDKGYTFEVKLPERSGPGRLAVTLLVTTEDEWPGHTHRTEDEVFYVLEGSLTFRCGDDQFDVDGGGFVFLPMGIQHGYKLRSPETRLLVATSPAPEGEQPGWDGFLSGFEDDCEFRG